MTARDPVLTSFELAAEDGQDITAQAYQLFYARCPQAREVMNHMDEHMQGRMLEEVLQLLMTANGEVTEGQLAFEVGNHRAYGTAPDQYRPLLEAVRDTIAAAIGKDWSPEMAKAWDARIAALLQQIQAYA